MSKQSVVAVSIALPTLATEIDHFLENVAGEPVAFLLVVGTDDAMQYVANVKREEGVALLEDLLARWKAGRADIPAHYNPDLKLG